MRHAIISTALAIAVLMAQTSVPALCATMFFNPDSATTNAGALDVVLPIDKLGSVPVPRGRININGNSVELSMIREWQFDRETVLYGKVLDTHLDSLGKQPIARGVIFFNEGQWIDFFDDHKHDETVVTDKAELVGRITDVTASDLVMEVGTQTRNIPLASVSEVRSPRVFTFAIPTTPLQQAAAGQPFYSDARSITFSATSRPFRLASLRSQINRQMDDGDWSTGKLIAVGAGMSLIEFAQLLPVIIVPIAAGHPYQAQLERRIARQAAEQATIQYANTQVQINQSLFNAGIAPGPLIPGP